MLIVNQGWKAANSLQPHIIIIEDLIFTEKVSHAPTYITEPSHTFGEYLLISGYSSTKCIPDNVCLKTPLVRYQRGESPAISLNIPMTSAIMQSVSDDTMAISLAKEGGLAFIPAGNEPSSHAGMDIWRLPRGSNTPQLCCATNLMPCSLLRGI